MVGGTFLKQRNTGMGMGFLFLREEKREIVLKCAIGSHIHGYMKKITPSP